MKRLILSIVGALALLGVIYVIQKDRVQPLFHTIPNTAFRAVYLVPDPEAATATIHLIVQAGEVDNDGPEGMAHYLEHLAWLDVFQSSGQGADRHANAWTNGNATVYWESFRAPQLSSAVTRMTKVLERPTLDADFSREEREIVRREYDLRVVGDPYADIMAEVRQSVFQDTPFARSVIGTPDSIAAMTVDAALALFDKTHQAQNAVVVIYGDLTEDQVLQAFGGGHLAQDPTSPTAFPQLPSTSSSDVQSIVAPIATPTLIYQKLIKRPLCGKDVGCEATLNILNDVLDSALPGGVAGPLRFDNFLARSFHIGLYHVGEDGVLLQFNAETDEGVTPKDLHDAFVATLDATASNGIPIETFEKVQDRRLSDFDADTDQAKTMRDVLVTSASIRAEPRDLHQLRRLFEDASPHKAQTLLDALVGEGRTAVRYVMPQ